MSLRLERKLATRRALLDAALGLMAEGRSFGALSLREVARAAQVVPTAFYRHFRDMDELGLVLVDEAFLTLRRLLREVRQAAGGATAMAAESVRVYLGYVRTHRTVFEFAIRERYGGTPAMRTAIAREVRFCTMELADDLGVIPTLAHLDRERLELVAHLIVSAVATLTGDLFDVPHGPGAADVAAALEARTVSQLTLIAAGAAAWRNGAATRRLSRDPIM